MLKCEQCSNLVYDDDIYCGKCGSKLPSKPQGNLLNVPQVQEQQKPAQPQNIEPQHLNIAPSNENQSKQQFKQQNVQQQTFPSQPPSSNKKLYIMLGCGAVLFITIVITVIIVVFIIIAQKNGIR